MRIKTLSFVAMSLAAITLITFAGTSAAKAASTGKNKSDLVEAIATKFNLKKSDVQQVFDEQRQTQLKNRLDQAVKNGKLTTDQESKILAKYNELQPFITSLQDKSEADRNAAIKAKMTELEKWAKDNNIPTSYLKMGPGFGLMHRSAHRPHAKKK